MKHQGNWRALLAVTSAFVLFGCAQPSNRATAPENIQDAFNIAPTALQKSNTQESMSIDKYKITIKKEALEKEFLLQGNWIFQIYQPEFTGMKSRVVIFRERGDQLVMLESNVGNSISNDLPQNLVLGSFPIISSTDEGITFDFAKGMTTLFRAYDWYASDFYGPWYFPEFYGVDAKFSYIEDMSFSQTNKLVIRQISQINSWSGFRSSIETRYYLSPYQPNPNFVPVENPDFTKVGFFEVNPQLLNQKDITYVSKWDSQKPIVFAVSANTPAEYKDAVKNGVLYWNKAFGREMIQVIDAPEGVTAPNADYNVVQWINYDDAGYAYADAQMDPRTGEIHHAQVFMSSAFAVSSKKSAKALLAKFQAENAKALPTKRTLDPKARRELIKKEGSPQKRLALDGFYQGHLCQRDLTNQLIEKLQTSLSLQLSDEQILKASQDYVTEVVAHEIGHTLGLRHNFAGSIHTNVDASKRFEIGEKYLKTGEVPAELFTSSSVMEYQSFYEGALTGHQIAKGAEALAHDKAAIGFLYNGEELKSDMPYFCTDTDVFWFTDCLPFDTGSNPYATAKAQLSSVQESLPYFLVGLWVAIKTDPSLKKYDFEDLYTSGKYLAWSLNNPRFELLWATMYEISPYLQVSRKFKTSRYNQEEVNQAHEAFIRELIQKEGGISTVLPTFPANYGKYFKEKVTSLISDTTYTTNVSYDGKEFSFSEDDQKRLMVIVDKVIADIEKEGVKDEMDINQMLTTYNEWLTEGKDHYYAQALKYLEQSSSNLFQGNLSVLNSAGVKKTIQANVPQYDFSFAGRQEALKAFEAEAYYVSLMDFFYYWFLGDTTEPTMWTSPTYRAVAKATLEERVKEAFGGLSASEINQSSLSSELQSWLSDMQLLIAAATPEAVIPEDVTMVGAVVTPVTGK